MLDCLPLDIILLIRLLLSPFERLPLSFVCKKFYANFPKYGASYTAEYRTLMVNHAAMGDHLSLVKWYYSVLKFDPFTSTLCTAAECHSMSTLEWIWENVNELHTSQVLIPWLPRAAGGMDLYLKHGRQRGVDVIVSAAAGGHFDIVKWLYSRDCALYQELWYWAAARGSIEDLEWLQERKVPRFERTDEALELAAFEGRKDSIQWFKRHIQKPPVTFGCHLTHLAAMGRQFELIKWMHSQGAGFDAFTFYEAVRHAEFETLEWLLENHCPLTEECCNVAINCNRWPVLDWLKKKGCPWSSHTFIHAVVNRAPSTRLSWLEKEGCPVSSSAATRAAEIGYLEALEWFFDNKGLLPNITTIWTAAYKGHLGVLVWMRDKFPLPFVWDWDYYIYAASNNKKVHVVQWLEEQRAMDPTLKEARPSPQFIFN